MPIIDCPHTCPYVNMITTIPPPEIMPKAIENINLNSNGICA